MNDFQKFLAILKEKQAAFVLLLCHRSADADAICSAYGLQGLLKRFAPEIIVIGGGMAEAADSYIKLVKKSAFKNSLENCRSEVRIERALLGSKAALIGAAFYSLSRLAGKSVW